MAENPLAYISDKKAEAAGEIARTIGKVVDIADKILGEVAKDAVSLAVGDWLHEQCTRNRAKLKQKTARMLEEAGYTEVQQPSPSIVLPLLEAAERESDEELQDLWAALLANSMIKGREPRKAFFEVIKKFEPEDAVVLRALNKYSEHLAHTQDTAIKAEVSHYNINPNEYQISLQALVDFKCAAKNSIGQYLILPFGKALLEACEVKKVG